MMKLSATPFIALALIGLTSTAVAQTYTVAGSDMTSVTLDIKDDDDAGEDYALHYWTKPSGVCAITGLTTPGFGNDEVTSAHLTGLTDSGLSGSLPASGAVVTGLMPGTTYCFLAHSTGDPVFWHIIPAGVATEAAPPPSPCLATGATPQADYPTMPPDGAVVGCVREVSVSSITVHALASGTGNFVPGGFNVHYWPVDAPVAHQMCQDTFSAVRGAGNTNTFAGTHPFGMDLEVTGLDADANYCVYVTAAMPGACANPCESSEGLFATTAAAAGGNAAADAAVLPNTLRGITRGINGSIYQRIQQRQKADGRWK